MTPQQEREQDIQLSRIDFARRMLDVWLLLLNERRAEMGRDPVTLRIPEEG